MDCSTPGLPVHHHLLESNPNTCPLSRWRHPTISFSVLPFSSHLQSFPASGSFQMCQFFRAQLSSQSNSHIHTWPLKKPQPWLDGPLLAMSLLFNILSSLVITFLPRSKRLLISWLQSPSAVILEPPKNKVWHCFHCFPIHFPWSDGTRYCV